MLCIGVWIPEHKSLSLLRKEEGQPSSFQFIGQGTQHKQWSLVSEAYRQVQFYFVISKLIIQYSLILLTYI
jgi:hypothetical protein